MPYATPEMKAAANNINLYDFVLTHFPEDCTKVGTTKPSIRLKSDPSVSISKGVNSAYDFADDTSYSNINFLEKYKGITFPKSVFFLLEGVDTAAVVPTSAANYHKEDVPTCLEVLPRSDGTYPNKCVFAYLTKKRGISSETVNMLIANNRLYEGINDGGYHNAVFINPERDFADFKGLTDKPYRRTAPGSRRDGFWYINKPGINLSNAKYIYICEAAVDAISLYELHRKLNIPTDNFYISTSGVGKREPIERILKKVESLNVQVVIASDNDKAGDNLRELYSNLKTVRPYHRKNDGEYGLDDWNDDLRYFKDIVDLEKYKQQFL